MTDPDVTDTIESGNLFDDTINLLRLFAPQLKHPHRVFIALNDALRGADDRCTIRVPFDESLTDELAAQVTHVLRELFKDRWTIVPVTRISDMRTHEWHMFRTVPAATAA